MTGSIPNAWYGGESPGWVAEMVYRRNHKFISNLRGRDGAHAARWLADEVL